MQIRTIGSESINPPTRPERIFVTGTMGGGKSAYILNHMRKHRDWVAYSLGTNSISSRNGAEIACKNIKSLSQINLNKNFVLDEVQFSCPTELKNLLINLDKKATSFIIAGLSRNLNGKFFETIENIHRVTSIEILMIPTQCEFCYNAGFTNFLRKFPSSLRVHRSSLVEKSQYCTVCESCRAKLPRLVVHTETESTSNRMPIEPALRLVTEFLVNLRTEAKKR